MLGVNIKTKDEFWCYCNIATRDEDVLNYHYSCGHGEKS